MTPGDGLLAALCRCLLAAAAGAAGGGAGWFSSTCCRSLNLVALVVFASMTTGNTIIALCEKTKLGQYQTVCGVVAACRAAATYSCKRQEIELELHLLHRATALWRSTANGPALEYLGTCILCTVARWEQPVVGKHSKHLCNSTLGEIF